MRVGGVDRPSAATVLTAAKVEGLNDTVRFSWSAFDAWFEEDEQVFVHPRNPYTRVDSLRSSRRLRVESKGVVLAETTSPVLCFETGLPTRYYIDRTDVDFTHLVPSDTADRVPLQGDHERLLVGQRRVAHPSRYRLDLRLPHPRSPAHRRVDRLLQREDRLVPRRRRARTAAHAFVLTGWLVAGLRRRWLSRRRLRRHAARCPRARQSAGVLSLSKSPASDQPGCCPGRAGPEWRPPRQARSAVGAGAGSWAGAGCSRWLRRRLWKPQSRRPFSWVVGPP